jgi:hypothetical protein
MVHTTVADFSKTTLETSGEDEELHSKRVEKIEKYARNEWRTLTLIR